MTQLEKSQRLKQSRRVDVVVHIPRELRPGKDTVRLRSLSLPVYFNDLAKKLVDAGFPEPIAMTSPEHEVIVTDRPSGTTDDGAWLINMDQPFLHFFNNVFLKQDHQSQEPSDISEAKLSSAGESVSLHGLVVQFHRTIRVPDNDKTHALPPNVGTFKLFNVGEAHMSKKFPMSVAAKGGAFISMYQREALWMSFRLADGCGSPVAVKVSVGGINALTGLPQNESGEGKQDYMVVGGRTGQLWLDGISTSPGVVRQFVAMPLGKGYTVEGQVTSTESIGGIQIDVFPSYDANVIFKYKDNFINIYRTPRQLGLSVGTALMLTSPSFTRTWTKEEQIVTNSPLSVLELTATVRPKGQIYVETPTGKTIALPCKLHDTVEQIKYQILEREGVPVAQQLIVFETKMLQDDRRLSDYGIKEGSTLMLMCHLRDSSTLADDKIANGAVLHLVLRLRGGGDPLHMECGFAAGGRISQKINRDPLPVTAYDHSKVQRLNISVINAVYFSEITGLPSPESPISVQTYLSRGYPWFNLYDENIPLANNTSSSTPLSGIRSVAQIDTARTTTVTGETQEECGFCIYEMATLRMSPCGHVFCHECSTASACPQCHERVTDRTRFAAAMRMPGEENGDGVEALSMDERIVKLKAGAKSGSIYSFKLKKDAISSLVGAGEV